MKEVKYAIIGAGIAGVSAAETIRRRDPDGEIVLFSAERQLPYSRPMLTKKPLRSLFLHQHPIREADWYRDMRIGLLTGVRVLSLDRQARLIRTAQEDYHYSKCILATGAVSFMPPFPGSELEGVYTVRTEADMAAVMLRASFSRRAVIIGGGVIGMECAFLLSEYGLDVTLLEAMPYLMAKQLDQETSETYRACLSGMQVFTNIAVAALEGGREVEGVRLQDGRFFPCELVLVSCGVRAETALAAAAGLEVNRGVVVDESMRTTDENIYACGDCAEFRGENYALWAEALPQGCVAGENVSGGSAVYTGCDHSLIINHPKYALFAIGELHAGQPVSHCSVEEAPDGRFEVNTRQKAQYSRLFYDGKRLCGAALIGNLSALHSIRSELLNGERKTDEY